MYRDRIYASIVASARRPVGRLVHEAVCARAQVIHASASSAMSSGGAPRPQYRANHGAFHGARLAGFGIFAETDADGITIESDGRMFGDAAHEGIVSARAETEQRGGEKEKIVVNALLIHEDTRSRAESAR